MRQVDEFWKRFLFKTTPIDRNENPEADINLAIEMVKIETLETNLQQSSGDEGGDIFENLFDNATQFIKVELETNEDISPKESKNDRTVQRNDDDNIVFSHPATDTFLCQQCGQSMGRIFDFEI